MIIESGLVKAGLVKTGLVRAISNINTRYYRRNEGTTDYATIPEVALAGHFVIEFDLLVTSFAGGVKVMDGGTDGGADRLDVNITALGVFDVRDYFKSYVNGVAGATVVLNQLNKIRIVRDATDANQSTRFLDILLARVNNTGNNLPGILANLKIWDNGTLIRDYPLDDNSDILRNRATVLGAELWNGVSDFPADTNVTAATGTTAGASYLTTISGLSGGEDFRFSGQSGFESVGNGVFVLTAPGSSMQFRSIGVPESGVTISIRQADGYGTVINGNASDWGLFQQQATGEWLGQELLVNHDFSQGDTGWSKDAAWTIASGQAVINNLSGIDQDLWQESLIREGATCRFVVDALIVSAGECHRKLNGDTPDVPITTAGISAVDLVSGPTGNVRSGLDAYPLFSGVINSVSVKEVLNVA